MANESTSSAYLEALSIRRRCSWGTSHLAKEVFTSGIVSRTAFVRRMVAVSMLVMFKVTECTPAPFP